MGRKKKSSFEWWRDRLNTLAGIRPSADTIYSYLIEQYPDAIRHIYSKGPWTAIKLAIIAYYIDLYTLIAKRHFRDICYVDTFAGSGLVRIKKYNRCLYGSALLSILATRKSKEFNKYVFVELNKDRSKLLYGSVKILGEMGYVDPNNVSIIPKDMNIVNYKEILEGCKHSLFVIDPDGLEPMWDTVRKILMIPADVSINFMTAGIRRVWGNAKKKKENNRALTLFFGSEEWIKARDENDLLDIYLRNIRNLGRKTIVIKVKGPGMFYYHIIFAVRKTKGGNPWLSAIENLKERVERTEYDTFRRLLDTFYGKTKPLF